ncbi:MAG: hypothetical protein KDC92_12645, partial [Bacteroidetes bacterium]|nr:hypothetical protein [Bacteroidota bacterium]
ISQLAKYPDLLARWNRLRPEYLELQVELSWEHGDKTVAREGKMVVRPATISTSGSWSSWSSPASCAWKELFPYCNYLDYNYFRELGVYDKMKECSGHYNDDNCQPKYCFKYSDKLDFYSDTYRENYSATFKVNKALWNEDEVLAIIEEFHKREKLEKEEGMSAEDFWNTPENEEIKEGGDEDFWNTPENAQTVAEKKRSDTYAANRRAVQSEIDKFPNYRKKYEALKNPCSISSHKDQQVIEEGKITLTGAVNSYFKDMGAQVAVSVNGEKFSTSNSSSSFSSTIILNEGWNKVLLDVETKSFGVQDSIRIFYKKPPPLPCNQNTASGGSGRTENEHGLGKESGTFYVSYNMNDAPDEMIIYSGPKERISSSKILYQTHGYVSGRNRIMINFKDIDTGIITVIMNGPSSGTKWEYQIECPE